MGATGANNPFWDHARGLFRSPRFGHPRHSAPVGRAFPPVSVWSHLASRRIHISDRLAAARARPEFSRKTRRTHSILINTPRPLQSHIAHVVFYIAPFRPRWGYITSNASIFEKGLGGVRQSTTVWTRELVGHRQPTTVPTRFGFLFEFWCRWRFGVFYRIFL